MLGCNNMWHLKITKGSHWQDLESELMSHKGGELSDMTLALLEDSGMYRVDYAKGST